jgi:flagellar hook protein FlgE
MMRSLFSGVSGLKNHQVRMDVIGNNISNVNTMAFKAGRVTFKEGFAQVLQGASRPSGDRGGTNPRQVGLGMQVGSIDTVFNQGNLESTGVATDLAIQGDAFFVLARGNERFFTRAGNFQLDAEGRLVSATTGLAVQGRTAVNGTLLDSVGEIRLPTGQQTAAYETTEATVAGNLNAAAVIGQPEATVDTSISVFDSQGRKHDLKLTFNKTAANTWDWSVDPTAMGLGVGAITDSDGNANIGGGSITFSNTGMITSPVPGPTISFTPPGGASPMSVALDFGDGSINGMTQFASSTTAILRDQDGYTSGTLQNFVIDSTGMVTGAFSNGTTQALGQIALAEFNNPGGLVRTGDNLYSVTANSGEPGIGFSGESNRSTIAAGALEMSNVDLTQEFTNMIVAQRGFQANGRVITGTDEMLQEVVNLKR